MLSTFSCTCLPSVCLLWKKVYSDILSICFLLSYISSFTYFEYLILIWYLYIFSHSVVCLLIVLIISFALQKFFSLMKTHLYFSAFVAFTFCLKPKKSLIKDQHQGAYLPGFSPGTLIVFYHTLKYLIHFELFLCKTNNSFILLHVAIWFS